MDSGNGPAPKKQESNMNDMNDVRELNDAELEAVSGAGFLSPLKRQENQEQMQALKTFTQALQGAAQI
jgi:hypothetical protein